MERVGVIVRLQEGFQLFEIVIECTVHVVGSVVDGVVTRCVGGEVRSIVLAEDVVDGRHIVWLFVLHVSKRVRIVLRLLIVSLRNL